MHAANPPQHVDERWQIAVAGRAARRVQPVANDRLRWLPPADGGGCWEATGDDARFVLDSGLLEGGLPAGWYVLRGRLEMADAGRAAPSVHLQYVARSALTAVDVVLPTPSAAGRFEMLLMLYGDVESLAFLPNAGSAQFRMRDFSLRRVSRLHALCKMLAASPGSTSRLDTAKRALAWTRAAARRGLKRAADEAYARYLTRVRQCGINEYDEWIRRYDTVGPVESGIFAQRARALDERGPVISVLLNARDLDIPEICLRRCLDALCAQAWQKWEVWIADGSPGAATVLAEYAERDSRIRISQDAAVDDGPAARGTALDSARGEFVVLLHPDIELRPHALLRMAEVMLADPELALIYPDQDTIDPEGRRAEPDFKPDWNPDLLRSHDYIGHCVAIRTTLARNAGGLRAGFGDSCGYDLVLRCSEKIASRQIRHIPEILGHRATGGADSQNRARPNADVATRAVAEHLERVGSRAIIETDGLPAGLRRICWPLPQPTPKVSLIIPTRDRVEMLRRCVDGIFAKTTYPHFEVLVVDNQSSERAALQYLRSLVARERVRVLRYDAPFNYSAINNWAANQCDGQLLGLVNNDIEVITPGWLEEMAGFALRPGTGAVGAMLYYPDDSIQHAGTLLGIHGIAGHPYVGKARGWRGYQSRALVAQNLSAVTGACMLVRRDVFEEVGGLDEQLPIEFNDVDFCLRLQQKGYRNVWTPFAELYHHESASRAVGSASATHARSAGVALMLERWRDILHDDPAYNPNLALQGAPFGLAFPPRRKIFGAPDGADDAIG